MPNPIQLKPGRQDFWTMTALMQTLPDVKLPKALPDEAQFAFALWQFPPLTTTQDVNDVPEIVSTDYNVAPTLKRGYVQVLFKVKGGTLSVNQGVFVPFGDPKSTQVGVAVSRQLSDGRTAYVRNAQGSQFKGGRLQVVSWTTSSPVRLFTLWSDVLSTDSLVALANTM